MAKSSTTWVKRYQAYSFTTDELYTVALKNDHTWGCSCKRWIFGRKNLPNGNCKHIESVLEATSLTVFVKNNPITVGDFRVTLSEEREAETKYVAALQPDFYLGDRD